MNTLNQIIRSALFFILTIVGVLMAAAFMVSTALAMAILYVVARISGRPFAIKSYWNKRRPHSVRPSFKRTKTKQDVTKNVTDIEIREIP